MLAHRATSRKILLRTATQGAFAVAVAAAIAAVGACSSAPKHDEDDDAEGAGGSPSSSSSSSSSGGSQAQGSGGGSAASSSGMGGSSATGAGGAGEGGAGGATGAGGGEPSFLCGNGAPESGEACDDGNTADGDYCSADCQAITGECGDGVLQSNETCDDGAVQAGCDTLIDGGNGKCVPAGTCSPGFVFVAGKCQPELLTAHVHIMVNNACTMVVDPMEFTVQPGQKLKVSYHNHSMSYAVDVWMHYNGGYTDLQPGLTWNEQYEHCFGPNASEGYADISTACSSYHLPIHCK